MKEKELSIQEGDRLKILHMEGEISLRLGTTGVVTKIENDPFESDNYIIHMKWDNGSSLSIMSKYDKWKKINEEKINESREKYYKNNKEIFDYFDHKFFRNYLNKVQQSSVINMYGATPFLYSGSEHLDRYYGENPHDEEAFQEVLEMADTAKDKMIQGAVKYLEDKKQEISVENVQREINKFSKKLLEFWITFH